MSRITTTISTNNNIDYLKLAVKSVRKNSYFKDNPFIIHAENCNDGTNEWLEKNKHKYNLRKRISQPPIIYYGTRLEPFNITDIYRLKANDIELCILI